MKIPNPINRTAFPCLPLAAVTVAVLVMLAPAANACGSYGTLPELPSSNPQPNKTADWYKDEECRRVFFAVLEGLYRDGISQEVVDLVIGGVEKNNIEKAFIFRCKLCHACFEAFAAYQRRPDFNGAEGVSTIGNREIPKEVIETLRKGSRRQFDNAFATIVQPWIKAELHEMITEGKDQTVLIQKFVKLADEGNALITGYSRCQACDAINEVAQTMADKEK